MITLSFLVFSLDLSDVCAYLLACYVRLSVRVYSKTNFERGHDEKKLEPTPFFFVSSEEDRFHWRRFKKPETEMELTFLADIY